MWTLFNQNSIVTVNDGDVVYTNTKNLHRLNPDSMKLFHQVYLAGQGLDLSVSERAQLSSLIRRVFLTKHSSWVYEEEVRVVKVWQSILETSEEFQNDPLRSFHTLSRDVAPGYAFDIISGLLIYYHQARIREVYLGVRNPLLMDFEGQNPNTLLDLGLVEKADRESWRVRALKLPQNSWGLKSEAVPSNVLAIREKTIGLINNFEFSGREAFYLRNAILSSEISEADKLEFTNWYGQCYLKINGDFTDA